MTVFKLGVSTSISRIYAPDLKYSSINLFAQVCYHFDLTEGLSTTDESSIPAEVEHQDVCGVISLLDFNPTNPWHRLPKRQRKILKNELRGFNMAAEKLRQQRSLACYQPKKLPLPVNPSTRIFFAYEMTRIAFCVDASPILTVCRYRGVDHTHMQSLS